MANTIILKHGNSIPEKGVLSHYELGYIEGQGLVIGDENGHAKSLLEGKITLNQTNSNVRNVNVITLGNLIIEYGELTVNNNGVQHCYFRTVFDEIPSLSLTPIHTDMLDNSQIPKIKIQSVDRVVFDVVSDIANAKFKYTAIGIKNPQ